MLAAGSASLWAEEQEQCKTVVLGKQEQTMICHGRISPLALFCHCASTSAQSFRSNSGDKSLREARSSRNRDQLRPGCLKAGCSTGRCRASVSSLAALEAFSPCWLLSRRSQRVQSSRALCFASFPSVAITAFMSSKSERFLNKKKPNPSPCNGHTLHHSSQAIPSKDIFLRRARSSLKSPRA